MCVHSYIMIYCSVVSANKRKSMKAKRSRNSGWKEAMRLEAFARAEAPPEAQATIRHALTNTTRLGMHLHPEQHHLAGGIGHGGVKIVVLLLLIIIWVCCGGGGPCGAQPRLVRQPFLCGCHAAEAPLLLVHGDLEHACLAEQWEAPPCT